MCTASVSRAAVTVVSLAVEAAAEVEVAMVAGVAMVVVAESSPAVRALSPFASLG
jgi:hypothetical protein